ncbi:MAG: hypothetical protein ACQETL_11575 [Bacteroidota bacterium]
MKNLILTSTLLTALLLFSFGCHHNDFNADEIIDKQDSAIVAKLSEGVQYAQSFNQLMIQFHDSLEIHNDPVKIAHHNNMIHHYDSAYHQLESINLAHHQDLNEKHHCNMMSGMMGNGHMMNSSGYSHHGGEYHCELMDEIMEYCDIVEDLDRIHPEYCGY